MEAKALTEIVKEVYFPLLEEKSIENIRPGQIVVQAIDLNEPPGKPIKNCKFKISVGYRTIIRDLDILRKRGENIPLRSTQQDIGRTTTHKEQIVKLWLEGNEPAYISKATNHSVDAVSRYLQSFKRVVALTLEGKDKTSIAFLLSISKPLVTRYQELFERYKDEALHTRIQEMESKRWRAF